MAPVTRRRSHPVPETHKQESQHAPNASEVAVVSVITVQPQRNVRSRKGDNIHASDQKRLVDVLPSAESSHLGRSMSSSDYAAGAVEWSDLSLGLLENICQYLSTEDVRSLRFTCSVLLQACARTPVAGRLTLPANSGDASRDHKHASTLLKRTSSLCGHRLFISSLILTVPALSHPPELHPGSIERISAPFHFNRMYKKLIFDLQAPFTHRIHTLELCLPSVYSKLVDAVASSFPLLVSLTIRNPTPTEAYVPGTAASTNVGVLAASLATGKLKLLRHADVETTCDEELASLALLTPLTSLAVLYNQHQIPDLRQLSCLTKLTSFHFKVPTASLCRVQLDFLEPIMKLPCLKSLSAAATLATQESVLDSLATASALTSLNLDLTVPQDAMQRLEQHLKFFERLRKTCTVQLTMRALEFFQATEPPTHAASVGLANAVELELDAWDCLDHQGRIHMHLMGPDAPATSPAPANSSSPAHRSYPASPAFDTHVAGSCRSQMAAQPQQLFSPLCGLPMLAFADLTHLTLTRVVMRPQDCHALGRNYSLHTLSVSCQLANEAGQILWPGAEWTPMHPELYDETELCSYRLYDTVSRDYPKLNVSDYPEAGFLSRSPGGHLLRSLEKLNHLVSLQLVAEQHPTKTAPVTKRSTAAAARAALLMPPPVMFNAAGPPQLHHPKRHHTRGSKTDVAGTSGAGPSCAGASKAAAASHKEDPCCSSKQAGHHHYSDQNTPPLGHIRKPHFTIHAPAPYRIPLAMDDLLAFIDANPCLQNVCLKGISLPASSDMSLFTPSTTVVHKPPSSHPIGANTYLPAAPLTATPRQASRHRGGSAHTVVSPCLMGIYTPLVPALSLQLQQRSLITNNTLVSTHSIHQGEPSVIITQLGSNSAPLQTSLAGAKPVSTSFRATVSAAQAKLTLARSCSSVIAAKSIQTDRNTSTAAGASKTITKLYSLRSGHAGEPAKPSPTTHMLPETQPAGLNNLPPLCPTSSSSVQAPRESGTPFGLSSILAHPSSVSHQEQGQQHQSLAQLKLSNTYNAAAVVGLGCLSSTPGISALADLYLPAPCISPTFLPKVFLLGRDLPGRSAAYFELEAVALDTHQALWIITGGRPASMHQEW